MKLHEAASRLRVSAAYLKAEIERSRLAADDLETLAINGYGSPEHTRASAKVAVSNHMFRFAAQDTTAAVDDLLASIDRLQNAEAAHV